MIKADKDYIEIKGTGSDLLREVISLVYSIRRNMKETNQKEWCMALDMNLIQIMLDKFDDNVATFKTFDNKSDYKAYSENHNQKAEISKNIMDLLAEMIKEENDDRR